MLQGGLMKKVVVLLTVCVLAAASAAQSDASLPAGTPVKVKLESALATFNNKAGDRFSARVMQPVVMGGKEVIPVGSTVQGRLTKVNEPRRIAGKPTIGMMPDTIILPNGEKYALSATVVDTSLRHGTDVNEEGQFKGAGHDRDDLAEVGLGTGAGMLIGGVAAGGTGVLVGGAIGATATVTHWLAKHRSGYMPAGTELDLELTRPMTMSALSTGE
jgi:hypothetical protein